MTIVASAICRKCGSPRIFQKGRYRCRPCLSRSQAERQARLSAEQREAQRIRSNLTRNERRANWGPEQREKSRVSVQAWRDTHLEQHRANARNWYARNIEYARAKKLADYYSDPEPFLARNHLRKARQLESVCSHGPDCVTLAFLTGLYSSACFYCGGPAEEADHFYPLSGAGLHCIENLVPACMPCNRSKHARDPHEWIASRS